MQRVPKYPNIEAERAKRGWSVETLMKALGVKSRKTYTNWCNKGKIELMADLFDCSTDYLLKQS